VSGALRRCWRAGGLLLLVTSTAAGAQDYARDQLRYQAEQQECRIRFAQALERPRRPCTGTCLTRAQASRDRCLARAEERYERALRRALRPYNH
jgi:hypothetical protein